VARKRTKRNRQTTNRRIREDCIQRVANILAVKSSNRTSGNLKRHITDNGSTERGLQKASTLNAWSYLTETCEAEAAAAAAATANAKYVELKASLFADSDRTRCSEVWTAASS